MGFVGLGMVASPKEFYFSMYVIAYKQGDVGSPQLQIKHRFDEVTQELLETLI